MVKEIKLSYEDLRGLEGWCWRKLRIRGVDGINIFMY